jgi:hypothetical protein
MSVLRRPQGFGLPFAWFVKVADGSHNHPANQSPIADPNNRVLTDELKARIIRQSRTLSPRQIEIELEADGFLVTRKDIHNVLQEERKRSLRGRTPTQAALMDIAEDPRGFGRFSTYETGALKTLFFSPYTAAQFLGNYAGVVMLDATYKTNRWV